MNLATYLSIINTVEILFPEEEEEPLEWSDHGTDNEDDGTGIDAEDAYPYWDDD